MIEHLKAEHRCKKCSTTLAFKHNHKLSKKERAKMMPKGFLKRFLWDGPYYDRDRQYWGCPKCFEQYLIDLREV